MSSQDLTLVAYNNIGGIINSVTVNGSIVYGSDWHSVMYNQSVVTTLDAEDVATGNAVARRVGKIVMKSLIYSEGLALKNFLETDLVYRGYYLGLELNGAQLDIGRGLGVDIVYADKCKLLNVDGDGLANRRAPGDYDIAFKYRFTV